MSDRIKIWVSRDLLTRAAANLQELAVYRRGVLEPIDENQTENWNALDGVRQVEADGRELAILSAWHPQVKNEDEQITAMQKLVQELAAEGLKRNMYYGDTADDLRSMFREAMRQREQAFSSWAALVDHQRVGLRAIRLLADTAMQQDTHRRKDARLYALIDVLDNVLADLMGINVDSPDYYHAWDDDRNGSWEVRRVLAEKRALELRVKELEERANQSDSKKSEGGAESDDDGDTTA